MFDSLPFLNADVGRYLTLNTMNTIERKELISEKRRLTNLLKPYNNDVDCYCTIAELLVKRISKINELLKSK